LAYSTGQCKSKKIGKTFRAPLPLSYGAYPALVIFVLNSARKRILSLYPHFLPEIRYKIFVYILE
jgi:hypothetical protein